MSSSQSCSHRNSVQNAPIEKFTALLGTTFVNISVFMSRGNFRATFGQPVRTSCTCSNLRFESLSLRFETFRFSEPPCARFEPHCEASRFEVEPLNLIRFETLVHYISRRPNKECAKECVYDTINLFGYLEQALSLAAQKNIWNANLQKPLVY